MKTRPRPWLAPGAVAAALVLGGLGAIPALADDGAERTVLDLGHVDVAAVVTDGAFSMPPRRPARAPRP
ncbi:MULTISPECIES: hypothetical protein [unclassified Nocardiopsis]|uniref:hypothetical protein n=1 Tax=Nocardiopsis TaxID=2013 RepID=UPI00387ADAB1